MRVTVAMLLCIVTLVYVLLCVTVGFVGPVATGVRFIRITFLVAVLFAWLPELRDIFVEVPSPRRDYLLAGVLLFCLSGVGFAFLNEAHSSYGTDNSILTSSVAGYLSFMLPMAAVFTLVAPVPKSKWLRWLAIVVGLMVATSLVFVAPRVLR